MAKLAPGGWPFFARRHVATSPPAPRRQCRRTGAPRRCANRGGESRAKRRNRRNVGARTSAPTRRRGAASKGKPTPCRRRSPCPGDGTSRIFANKSLASPGRERVGDPVIQVTYLQKFVTYHRPGK